MSQMKKYLSFFRMRFLMDGSPEELKQDAASMDEAVVKLYRSFDEKEGR